MVGVSEAAFLMAWTLGRRYAIVAMTKRLGTWYRECAIEHGLEAISLRVRQIACAAGAIASSEESPLSHAIHLIEECLWEVERKVDAAREAAVAAADVEALATPVALDASRKPGRGTKRKRR